MVAGLAHPGSDDGMIIFMIAQEDAYRLAKDIERSPNGNSNLSDAAVSIGEELDEKTKELGISPAELILKLRGIIGFPNRDYLRELLADGIDYNDLIGDIYGMIIDEGGDPDAILKYLGATE